MRIEFTRPGTLPEVLLRQRAEWNHENLRTLSFDNDETWRAFAVYQDDGTLYGAVFFTKPALVPSQFVIDAVLIHPEFGGEEARLLRNVLPSLVQYARLQKATRLVFTHCLDPDLMTHFGFAQESVSVGCELDDLRLPAAEPAIEKAAVVETVKRRSDGMTTAKCGRVVDPVYLSRHVRLCKRGCNPPEVIEPVEAHDG